MLRVGEFAKELKIPVKSLIKHLYNMGVVVKNSESKMDEEIAESIRAKFNEELASVKKRQLDRETFYRKILLYDLKKKIIKDLTQIYNFPQKRITIEPEIKLGKIIIRPDIVVYEDDDLKKPLIIVETKKYITPTLSEKIKEQLFNYCIKLNAKYGVIILPTSKFVFVIEKNKFKEIPEIPFFDKEKVVKELTSEEIQKLKLIIKKQLKFLPLFALPSLAKPILPLIIPAFLLASSKSIINTLKKDNYTITGNDFYEEHKEIILISEIKDFIIFVKNHFNLKHNKDLIQYLSDNKESYETTNSIFKINRKLQILSFILHLIDNKDIDSYKEFNKLLITKLEELIEKDEKEKSLIRVEEQKRMISYLTHTLRNALSAGPQIAKSITSNLKFLLGDSYLVNNAAYNTINNATSLLTTFKYVDNLIDTFKLFSSDRSTITKKWENETDGDLLIGNLVNQTLIQTISKILFYESYLDERKQLFNSEKIRSIKESFLEDVLLNTETDNRADILLSWLNMNSTTIQAGPFTAEFNIKNNGIRFGILFSIISELISNSFSYFNEIGKIEIDINDNEQFIEFICRNHYDENLNITKGTNKGIYFIKHIVSLVDEITFDVSQKNGVWISIIKIKK